MQLFDENLMQHWGITCSTTFIARHEQQTPVGPMRKELSP
jgi:hypothetical protein